jgi:RNA recognition motif-containing protein
MFGCTFPPTLGAVGLVGTCGLGSLSRASSLRGANCENSMSNRLFVGNLSFNTTADHLRSAFSESGDVVDVHVVMDRETGRARGFGFVTMGNAPDAASAVQAMNGAMLEGRPLRVNAAEERPAPRRDDFGGGGGAKRRSGGARW